MMNGLKQSDPAIVPMRATNKGTSVPAESTEGRAGTKGNPQSQSTHRTQSRARVSPAAARIRQAATRKPKEKLTALLHHITTEALGAAYLSLKREAAAGVDGVTWHEYGEGLAERLRDLHDRVHSGAYRALPSRRVEIPKPDGGTRPLGIAALEDKIVQKAVAETILSPIYEPVFLGFSYGFRPGRGAHDALDALAFGIKRRRVNWIADADIRSYFDRIDRDWLVRFLEHRIGDRRVIRLIVKWLDAVAHCRTETRARQVLSHIKRRLAHCRLDVHPEKTRIVYCKDDDRPGRYPTEQFTFLGYTFRSRRAKNRWGHYFISFIPAVSNAAATRMRQTMRRWHLPRRSDKAIDDLARMWNPVFRGWIQYYGRFYKSALYSVFRHLNGLLVRWAMRKYKRLRRHRRRAIYWLGGLARREPRLFAHWHLLGLTPAAG